MTEPTPIVRPPTVIELIIQRLDTGKGDQRLWRAIISQALKDLTSCRAERRKEATDWFVKARKDYRWICDNASISFWRLRKEVMKELKIAYQPVTANN
jgi:hypothetical protein